MQSTTDAGWTNGCGNTAAIIGTTRITTRFTRAAVGGPAAAGGGAALAGGAAIVAGAETVFGIAVVWCAMNQPKRNMRRDTWVDGRHDIYATHNPRQDGCLFKSAKKKPTKKKPIAVRW